MTKLLKRIIIINQRRTSMRLCQEEWNALDDICRTEKNNRNTLIGLLENIPDRKLGLTYLTRLFMLMYYRDAAEKVRQNGLPVSNSRISQILLRIEKLPHDSQK